MITVVGDDEANAAETDAYDLDKADEAYGRSPTPEMFSFFEMDAFSSAAAGRPKRNLKVTFAPQVTFMDTARQDNSLKALWSDVWRGLGRKLDNASHHV